MIDTDKVLQVDGNKESIAMLKQWLDFAEKGTLCHVAIVGCEGPQRIGATAAGALGMEYAINFGLDILKYKIYDAVNSKQFEPAKKETTADYHIYNLAKMPTTYDFVGWLINAEMVRRRNNAPGPLKVVWYWGKNNKREECLNNPERIQTFENIVRPMLKLIGAVEANADTGCYVESVSMQPIVDAVLNGERVPQFKSPMDWWDYQPRDYYKNGFMTITLRETDHWPQRNSNVKEWVKFAKWLKKRGEHVVFIRDAEKVNNEPFHGFATVPAASTDLIQRTALYQASKCNFFVSNGPAMLALYMDRPWLMFNEVDDNGLYKPNTTAGWKECVGISPGEQWPWCRNDQRIIWKKDTFEVMRDAYLEFIK